MILIYFSSITNQILNHQKYNSFIWYKNSLTTFFVLLSSTDISIYTNIMYVYILTSIFSICQEHATQASLHHTFTPSFTEGQTARQF